MKTHGFNEYWNSTRRNPDRPTRAIAGRRSGTYTDIFGKTHTTSGSLKGKNIEGRYVHDSVNGTPYYITPMPPSRTLKNAEQWLLKTYLPQAYENAIKRTDIMKCFIEK